MLLNVVVSALPSSDTWKIDEDTSSLAIAAMDLDCGFDGHAVEIGSAQALYLTQVKRRTGVRR